MKDKTLTTGERKIIVEEDRNKSPCKNRPKRKKAFNRLDECDLGVIRQITYSFCARGKSPRLVKLKLEINFSYSMSRLRLELTLFHPGFFVSCSTGGGLFRPPDIC